MRLSRISSFTLGVLVTAVSIGAVNYVSAAGDATIKACANKKTGAMRYITKGSCKKTETSLKWNQMGPQGLPGATGAAGVNATNSKDWYVVDSQGRTLGKFVSIGVNDSFAFMTESVMWAARPDAYGFYGVPEAIKYYSDSACQNRLIPDSVGSRISLSHQWVGIEHNSEDFGDGNLQRAFTRLNDTKWPRASFSNIYRGGFGTGCQLDNPEGTPIPYFYKAVEIPKLSYSAPLSIVER